MTKSMKMTIKINNFNDLILITKSIELHLRYVQINENKTLNKHVKGSIYLRF